MQIVDRDHGVIKDGAIEDAKAVSLVLAGDTAAFAMIVRRWQVPLINMAWRFCRDRGRAEDMAQAAFLRAYTNLAQWRHEAAFSTWLFALAANVYRSELKRIPPTMLSLDEIVEPPDTRVRNLELDEAEQASRVRNAVLALPAMYRDALTLYYFHEQDVPTAARSLGVPVGTLKIHLHRGRELLRAKFSKARSGSNLHQSPAGLSKEAK